MQLSATHHLVERKGPILFLAFMLITTAGGVIGWVGSELAGALALIAGMLGFIVGVLYFVARERGRRNRFGIFEKGIAPPWKPVSCRSKGRTVVPYSRILRLEYVAPDCLRVVVFNAGSFWRMFEYVDFSLGDIKEQGRLNLHEVARVRALLRDLSRQIRRGTLEDRRRSDSRFEPNPRARKKLMRGSY